MKIIKIEENEENPELTKIHILHNGMDAYYYLIDTFHFDFFEEIKNFRKVFFNSEYEDWNGVMQEDDIHDFFNSCEFIKNDKHDMYVSEKQEFDTWINKKLQTAIIEHEARC